MVLLLPSVGFDSLLSEVRCDGICSDASFKLRVSKLIHSLLVLYCMQLSIEKRRSRGEEERRSWGGILYCVGWLVGW